MKNNKKADFNVIKTFCTLSEALEEIRVHDFKNIIDELGNQIPITSCDALSFIQEDLDQDLIRLSEYLHTTPLQTLFFIATYSKQINHRQEVDLDDIARFFGVNAVSILPLHPCLIELINKNILILSRQHFKDGFFVNGDIEYAMHNNECLKMTKKKKKDCYQFCAQVSGLIKERSNEKFSTWKLFELVQNLEKECAHLSIIKQLQKLGIDVEDRTFFYEACDDFLQSRSHHTGLDITLKDIYGNAHDRINLSRQFIEERHPLLVNGLLELLPANFVSDAEITLTEKGQRIFLGKDFDLFDTNAKTRKNLVVPEDIPEKRLFFGEELTQRLSMLQSSLMPQQLDDLQKRLEEKALPKGVTVLFHGTPGTGKTEAAMQLAKATGRSVFHVEIAACKSKWFGDSEKIMKKLFNTYRDMCKREKLKPILLFNEADAIFSQRRDVGSSPVAQTENAIQNILLEEIEKLDGILIATTNLTKNFDDAFARRFLFKIEFSNPSQDAKQAIWKDKLPWLSEEEAATLAQKHNLSGGEIDNVVRKSLMEEVINGTRPSVETLSQWSSDEKLNKEKCKSIGFVA